MKIVYRSSTRKFKLSRQPDKRWHLIRTLVTQLITHERIKTTSAKAKHMRATVEYILGKAKRIVFRGEVHLKQKIFGMLTTQEAREKLLAEIAPRLEKNKGACTRVRYLYNRSGDNAPVSMIEIVGKSSKKRNRGPGEKARKGVAKERNRAGFEGTRVQTFAGGN